jgi:sulfur carrier protein
LIWAKCGAYDYGLMKNITLEINGEQREIPPVENVSELLQQLGITGSHVAVELNRTIIRQRDWESTPVSNHDRVEIVQFVGGG